MNLNDELKKNKIQSIDCFCGINFKFDWSKVPTTEKTIYVRCPSCNSELKRGNPYFENNKGYHKKSY